MTQEKTFNLPIAVSKQITVKPIEDLKKDIDLYVSESPAIKDLKNVIKLNCKEADSIEIESVSQKTKGEVFKKRLNHIKDDCDLLFEDARQYTHDIWKYILAKRNEIKAPIILSRDRLKEDIGTYETRILQQQLEAKQEAEEKAEEERQRLLKKKDGVKKDSTKEKYDLQADAVAPEYVQIDWKNMKFELEITDMFEFLWHIMYDPQQENFQTQFLKEGSRLFMDWSKVTIQKSELNNIAKRLMPKSKIKKENFKDGKITKSIPGGVIIAYKKK